MNSIKDKILIVDDSEMNRAILSEILEGRYDILEAEDGETGLEIMKKRGNELSLVLLDIVMPGMDGYEVLDKMNELDIISSLPVIMISAENGVGPIRRAFELGVSDFISRPFDSGIVIRRVTNIVKLYSKQKRLIEMVVDQIYEKQKSNKLMINILSHIVEFRNGESGQHVLNVNIITNTLLKCINKKTDKYNLSNEDIELISMASALHDIGKIAIPDEILNKPGRFTDEEYAIMKTHSAIGASLLDEIPFAKDEPMIKVSHDICRWHHERWDGRGYPDGLKGEEIPISAQAVSMADVYDALTSERVYKAAYSHEKSIEMILNGECGAFNPLLLECLVESADQIRDELKIGPSLESDKSEIVRLTEEILRREEKNMASGIE